MSGPPGHTPPRDPDALWLGQLAHDLRNQLAPMRTATQMLQGGRLEGDRAREMLDLMERQIQRLVRMLDDLAEYGRMRSDTFAPAQRHDLGILIDTAVGECGRRFVAAGQHFEQQLPERRLPLDGDRQRLVQALVRLLDNACRYTPEGGSIALTVEADEAEATVRIRDSGAGIESERLERIFDLPERSRSTGGLGISLALARATARAHGGSLEARSDGPGRGSEFVLRLPLARDS